MAFPRALSLGTLGTTLFVPRSSPPKLTWEAKTAMMIFTVTDNYINRHILKKQIQKGKTK